MNSHTKGPWEIRESEDSDGIECKELIALGGKLTGIAMIYSPNDENVIVAAPLMFEALKAARDLCGDYLPPGNSNAMKAMKLVDSAISIAEGKS